MLAAGKPVHGLMRDILIEMQMREMEKEDWKKSSIFQKSSW
jgi:hypothetical protein